MCSAGGLSRALSERESLGGAGACEGRTGGGSRWVRACRTQRLPPPVLRPPGTSLET